MKAITVGSNPFAVPMALITAFSSEIFAAIRPLRHRRRHQFAHFRQIILRVRSIDANDARTFYRRIVAPRQLQLQLAGFALPHRPFGENQVLLAALGLRFGARQLIPRERPQPDFVFGLLGEFLRRFESALPQAQ